MYGVIKVMVSSYVNGSLYGEVNTRHYILVFDFWLLRMGMKVKKVTKEASTMM